MDDGRMPSNLQYFTDELKKTLFHFKYLFSITKTGLQVQY